MDSGRRFTALWRDVDVAKKQWMPGARCDLALELCTQARQGKTYHNWSVVSLPTGQTTVLNHRDELAATDSFQPPAQPRQL